MDEEGAPDLSLPLQTCTQESTQEIEAELGELEGV